MAEPLSAAKDADGRLLLGHEGGFTLIDLQTMTLENIAVVGKTAEVLGGGVRAVGFGGDKVGEKGLVLAYKSMALTLFVVCG